MQFYLIQTALFLIRTKLYYGKENKPKPQNKLKKECN